MHAQTIMLERSRIAGLDKLLSPRGRWQVAYRSWRAEQRSKVFPTGKVLMMSKLGPVDSPMQVDWRPREDSDAGAR